jgi:hypothetical protein
MNAQLEPDPGPTPPKAESLPGTNILGTYLIVMAVALGFLLYALWPTIQVDPKDASKQVWDTAVPLLGSNFKLGAESRLILLVMLAGALGSYVHTATSFVTYVGNRSLKSSWMWWYVLRPFIGMTLAVIFYFVIRGGLLSAGAGASEVSPFGITAVAALAGMFSKQATDKLRDVFDNLFKTEKGKGDEQRGDKLAGDLPVSENMLPINKISSHQIPKSGSEKDVNLLDLHGKYGGVVTRMPVLNDSGAVRHVIHQSLIYKFISAKSIAASESGMLFDPRSLTLEDFLNFKNMREIVTEAIAFVPETANLEQAKEKMEKISNCQDVFVTETGKRDEPIKGWLTNVDIGRLSKA